MNIYPYFFKSRRRADGSYPVYIFVSRPPKRRFCINSGLSSTEMFEGMSFPKKEPNSRIKTAALVKMITEIEALALSNPGMSDESLKSLIEEKIYNKVSRPRTLHAYLRAYAEKSKSDGSKALYERTAKKVEEFDENAGLEIDKHWLERFVESLSPTHKVNSIAIHLRNIRTVFNWALDNDWTTNYPFRKFKIKREETRKRNIPVELIREIRTMPTTRFMEKYRDMFILSFLLIGVNSKDLLLAKPEQLRDGRFEYKRAKTGKEYSIKVEPEAMELIKKYKGKNYLLCFCDKNSNYKTIYSRADDFLATIQKGISIYSARHSWATIASDLDIPIDTISSALGHSHGAAVTNVYINRDRKKVDEANRKVIDFVFGDNKKEGK